MRAEPGCGGAHEAAGDGLAIGLAPRDDRDRGERGAHPGRAGGRSDDAFDGAVGAARRPVIALRADLKVVMAAHPVAHAADLLARLDRVVKQKIKCVGLLQKVRFRRGRHRALSRGCAQRLSRLASDQLKTEVIQKMSTGRISHYDEGRGFGYIIPDGGGADVFVHENYLVNADALRTDQRVSFEVVNDDRRESRVPIKYG
jgi:CspA family cold shock protein